MGKAGLARPSEIMHATHPEEGRGHVRHHEAIVHSGDAHEALNGGSSHDRVRAQRQLACDLHDDVALGLRLEVGLAEGQGVAECGHSSHLDADRLKISIGSDGSDGV